MRSLKMLVTIASFMAATAVVHATPVPPLNLAELCERSDLIVVGRIEVVQQLGESQMEVRGSYVQVTRMQAEMMVDYVLKGQMNPGRVSFQFVLPQPESLGYRGVPSSYRIVFLRSTGADWQVADPFYPSFPATPHAATKDAGVFANVVGELAAALGAVDASKDDQVTLIWVLGTVQTPAATRALRAASRSTNQTVRIQSIATLLEQNETSMMPVAVELLSKSRDIPGYLVQNVASGIARGVREPSAIPYLAKLLRNADVRVRRSAATALRQVGTDAAARELGLALQDSDFEVRYNAVIGIADITGQTQWRPLLEEFRDREDEYLSHWK
ncbi:MAG TPA: HEAT repeat domain-containing protein [Terriglobales bacterium]|nr:HEAT repeat domain-containing protein [Terriglobales bacterium]